MKKEDIYIKNLLEKVDEIKRGLKYYSNRSMQLENELSICKNMYENRVNEYFKMKEQNEKIIQEMATQLAGFSIYDNDDLLILNTKEEVIDYFRKRCNDE